MKLKTQLKNSKLKNFDQKTCHPNHRFEIRANMAAFRAKQSNMADEPAEVEGRQDGYLSPRRRRRHECAPNPRGGLGGTDGIPSTVESSFSTDIKSVFLL